MSWFKKKEDPISDRARALNDEIARLESQIKRLENRLEHNEPQPRLRSTAVPHGATLSHTSAAQPTPVPSAAPGAHEPIFEEMAPAGLDANSDGASTPQHYNDLGVRKYDLPALWHRVRNHFRGPATTNPKLVSYLAAGGIQGLRPLRYEKRVARNRLIVLIGGLFLLLLGLVLAFYRQHH